MKLWLLILLVLFATNVSAQYPFEKYPAIKYKLYTGWKFDTAASMRGQNLTYYIVVPHFFGQESLKLQAITPDNNTSSFIRIYKGKKFIQKLNYLQGFSPDNFDEPLRIADINGDSLNDIKLMMSMKGCGLAAMNVRSCTFSKARGTGLRKWNTLIK